MEASLTLYDMAKQMVANESIMDPLLVNKEISSISKLMDDKYYMLICPDLRQYVIMHINKKSNIEKELSSLLNNRGQILLIDREEEKKKVWEFWLKDIYNNEIYMYQLTPYEVVEV